MAELIEYDRVSRVGDRDETSESFQTVKQQRKAAKAIVGLTPGARIIDRVEALNASGGKDWPEPKLAEVIDRVDRGEADGVVVYALDRFGRHLKALEVIERWAEEGKVFLSASEKFDATTPMGRMCLRMMMSVASWYWEQSKERFAVSQADALEDGKFVGPTPLGYTRERIVDGKPKGKLIEDPVTGPIMRKAYKIAAADGIHAARLHLLEKAPGPRWDVDQIRNMLASRVYLGEAWIWVKENGKRRRKVNPNAHEPLASEELWAAAQTEPGDRRTNGEYPLSEQRKVRCGNCGEAMVGQLQTTPRGYTYRRMRCGSCARCSISADKLEQHVLEVLEKCERHLRYRLNSQGADADEFRVELQRAKAKRTAYVTKMDPEDPDFEAGLRVHDRALQEAEERWRQADRQEREVAVYPAGSQLQEPGQFQRALRAGVERILVRPGRGPVSGRVEIVSTVLDDNGAPWVLTA